MRVTSIVLALLAATGIGTSFAAGPNKPSTKAATQTVEVSLPNGISTFPPGPGSTLANQQCVICHSVDMVTRQPPLSFESWKAEVLKMRAVYGAPLPPEQVEDIARYLTRINGTP
ncbi:exported hypothetical protein [Paraburkholderia piptadeniae]|uniref:Cytochrome c n=1 Tax=Paraburkholderia piptadeniae TaxID=1701573 RepID=A0A1N7S9D5_9BURK|nr:cytochrome c [Paraburkholderia piptadeniae]SIT43997.1 exported hypothetical protein [Paraburkholderia piptadeniae]